MRFPRVLRLDESDRRLYDTPATPGEWAVPGSFSFLDVDPSSLSGKQRQAFRHGFLGTVSFGWSTVVQVDEINNEEFQSVIDRLAQHFVMHHGAPDLAAATVAAREEAEFAASICDQQLHTLIALDREVGAEGIVENFKRVRPPDAGDHNHIKLWAPDDEQSE